MRQFTGLLLSLCFNEAATIQSRKSERCSCIGDFSLASMRPRLFSRGNGAENDSYIRFTVASMRPRLFSRGNVVVTPTSGPIPPPASMRPRLFSRGNAEPKSYFPETTTASMRPRLFSRGNLAMNAINLRRASASMRPRLFSRGNAGAGSTAIASCAGFNEAATIQSRK